MSEFGTILPFGDLTFFALTVRLEEAVDMSTTIKFVFIQWHGEKVQFSKRGKFGVVSGSVEKHFTVN